MRYLDTTTPDQRVIGGVPTFLVRPRPEQLLYQNPKANIYLEIIGGMDRGSGGVGTRVLGWDYGKTPEERQQLISEAYDYFRNNKGLLSQMGSKNIGQIEQKFQDYFRPPPPARPSELDIQNEAARKAQEELDQAQGTGKPPLPPNPSQSFLPSSEPGKPSKPVWTFASERIRDQWLKDTGGHYTINNTKIDPSLPLPNDKPQNRPGSPGARPGTPVQPGGRPRPILPSPIRPGDNRPGGPDWLNGTVGRPGFEKPIRVLGDVIVYQRTIEKDARNIASRGEPYFAKDKAMDAAMAFSNKVNLLQSIINNRSSGASSDDGYFVWANNELSKLKSDPMAGVFQKILGDYKPLPHQNGVVDTDMGSMDRYSIMVNLERNPEALKLIEANEEALAEYGGGTSSTPVKPGPGYPVRPWPGRPGDVRYNIPLTRPPFDELEQLTKARDIHGNEIKTADMLTSGGVKLQQNQRADKKPGSGLQFRNIDGKVRVVGTTGPKSTSEAALPESMGQTQPPRPTTPTKAKARAGMR